MSRYPDSASIGLDEHGRGIVRAGDLQPYDYLVGSGRTVLTVGAPGADPTNPARRRVVRVATRRGTGPSARDFVGYWNVQTTIRIERTQP